MRIDFFVPACQTINISAPLFGLTDPQDGGPAYVNLLNPSLWVAKVDNRSNRPLNFTAVDNCIDILREHGQMDNRCDGILTSEDYLIFVELKDQREEWTQHAVENQLKTTIRYYKGNYDITRYKKRFAYAYNKRHPQFQCSHMSLMEKFRQDTGVRLCIVNTIVIK